MRAYACAAGLIALTGCAQTPVTVVEKIQVPTWIPVPATLIAPTKVDLYPGITYGDALGALREGLTSCDADKAAIGTLKPPNPPINP